MSNLVFNKTERGKTEMARRSGQLSPTERQVLIMVNGVDSVTTLTARGLPHTQTHLSRLFELGLIAPLPGQTAPPPAPRAAPPATHATHATHAVSAPAAPPRRASAPPPPPPLEEEFDPRLNAQCRLVLEILTPIFGPNAPEVAQAMLMARTVDEFNAAIDQIETRLIGHLGRKHALRETQPMRLEPE
jgi:hypothetical protein